MLLVSDLIGSLNIFETFTKFIPSYTYFHSEDCKKKVLQCYRESGLQGESPHNNI